MLPVRPLRGHGRETGSRPTGARYFNPLFMIGQPPPIRQTMLQDAISCDSDDRSPSGSFRRRLLAICLGSRLTPLCTME